MQLKIRHQVGAGLTLPLNYHHILQSIIYHHLRCGSRRYQNHHDDKDAAEKRQYKHFTFSLIRGKYRICGKKIIFEETIEYEIRSPEARMIHAIERSIRENGITYGETHFDKVELILSDREAESGTLQIRMVSPICIYSTEKETGFTHYYAPWEEKFSEMIRENFRRKYEAYCGMYPSGEICITPLKVTEKDKMITNYKGIYLCGWKGEYLLQGSRKYLNFLYQSGLGSKNSQGFGMFEIISGETPSALKS